MYAIVEIAGFQEMVKEGDSLRIPLREDAAEAKITFSNVLLLGNGDDVTIGAPYVAGALVEMEVLGNGKGDKIRVVKNHRRKRYRRLQGHRQKYTSVRVTKITVA